MARHAKTLQLIDTARAVLTEYHPMTVRQVYYQLVSRQVIKNNRSQYQAVSVALRDARKEELIPWTWIEDRLRRPRDVSMWHDLSDFAGTAIQSYRRDVWASQSIYLECWLEKDALSGIFEDLIQPYGVTLNVGRGYDGWDSIHNAARRYGNGEAVTVLYFGDFDPSGEDMVRSLKQRIGFFECWPEIIKIALNLEDISTHNLPPDFTKVSDSRSAAFVAKYGDMAVELDALPAPVLQSRLKKEIERRLDLGALAIVKREEEQDRQRLAELLNSEGD